MKYLQNYFNLYLPKATNLEKLEAAAKLDYDNKVGRHGDVPARCELACGLARSHHMTLLTYISHGTLHRSTRSCMCTQFRPSIQDSHTVRRLLRTFQ